MCGVVQTTYALIAQDALQLPAPFGPTPPGNIAIAQTIVRWYAHHDGCTLLAARGLSAHVFKGCDVPTFPGACHSSHKYHY
jgi:hypothetical protein